MNLETSSTITRVVVLGLCLFAGAASHPCDAATTDSLVAQLELLADDAAAGDEFGFSVSTSGDTVVVGAPGADSGKGTAYVFERSPGTNDWAQVARLTAADGAAGERFGESVSVSGNTAVVGARAHPHPGRPTGAAYVFERNAGGPNEWGRVKELLPPGNAGLGTVFFGASVSIDVDTIVVGAPSFRNPDLDTLGAAVFFERNRGGAGNWGQAELKFPSNGRPFDAFGGRVSISGDSAIVGAAGNSSSGPFKAGAAYIFERNHGGPGNWGQVTPVTASDAAADDAFGSGVSISRDTAIVGAAGHDDNGPDSGAAYVFERGRPGNLALVLPPTVSASSSLLGFSRLRAVDGDLNTSWFANHGDAASLPFLELTFPQDVTVNELRMFGNRQSSVGFDFLAGRFELFAADGAVLFDSGVVDLPAPDRDLTLPVPGLAGVRRVRFTATADESSAPGFAELMVIGTAEGVSTWAEVKKVTPTGAAANDSFGGSVSIDGDTALVGAARHAEGGQTDAGAAYIFERDRGGADQWGQAQELAALDAAAGDNFGTSVSLSGATAIVGASRDDDRGADAGAAYVLVPDPAAGDDSYSVDEEGTLAVPDAGALPVLANDRDAGGAPLMAVLVRSARQGTVTLDLDGSFLYEPKPDFVGRDHFTYKARNAAGIESNTATVTITVNPINDAPSFVGRNIEVDEDAGFQSVAGWATAIRAGPLDEAGQTLSFVVTTDNDDLFAGSSVGAPAIAPNGTLTYRADFNLHGTATITVSLQDNGGTLDGGVDISAPQAFTITVRPVNDAPGITSDSATTAEDTPALIDVLANDFDEDDDTLTIHSVVPGASPNLVPHGSVSIVGGKVLYTPDPNFSGQDGFRYTISDGTVISNARGVGVIVTAVHDNPIANPDTVTVAEDSITTIAVLANDAFGPDGGVALAVTGVSQGANGRVVIRGGTSVVYTPNPNFFGTDVFKYAIGDGGGGSAKALVSVIVTAVNDAPVNTVPGRQPGAVNQPLVFSAARGNPVSVADVDARDARVTLDAVGGVARLSGTNGLTFLAGGGINGASMTFTGTIADVNAALEGMVFTPTSTVASLTITTDDQGQTGAGGARRDTDTIPIGLFLSVP